MAATAGERFVPAQANTSAAAIPHIEDPESAGFDVQRLGRLDEYLDRCVEMGLNHGSIIMVAREGRMVHASTRGMRDPDRGLPVEADTVWRLYSMTKPVTSVAAMMLWEEGGFAFSDPVAKFIPSFSHTRVYRGGSGSRMRITPATEPIRIHHLLTHTAGMTVAGAADGEVDSAYRAAGIPALGEEDRFSLPDFCDRLASLPLLFEPGSAWNYSHATDVLGRVIEVVTGSSLDDFMRERIFDPLGMGDTGFRMPAEDRLAVPYRTDPLTGSLNRLVTPSLSPGESPPLIAGGHGLMSTALDYYRFVQMLAAGGVYGHKRLLAPRTVELMATNHLPGGATISAFSHQPARPAPHLAGRGFGLGFACLLDPVAVGSLSSRGEYGWGGAAGTNFWIDPEKRLTVVFMMQVMPPPVETWLALRRLVYQALVG